MVRNVGFTTFVFLLAVLQPGARAACYYASGRLAPNDVPCRDDTEHATCCGQGYACLSNGICQATGEEMKKPEASEFVRGACTDQSWRSSSCPLFCIEEGVDFLDGGNGIVKCHDRAGDVYHCLNGRSRSDSCELGIDLLFFPGTPSAITTIGVAPARTSSSTTTERTSSSSSSSSSSSATPTTDSESTTPGSTGTESPTATTATTTGTGPSTADPTHSSTASPPPGPSPPPRANPDSHGPGTHAPADGASDASAAASSSSSSPNIGAIVGGVIGGVVAILLAALTGWILARRRARASAGADAGAGAGPGSSGSVAAALTDPMLSPYATHRQPLPPPSAEFSHPAAGTDAHGYPVGAYEAPSEAKVPLYVQAQPLGGGVYHELLPHAAAAHPTTQNELPTERCAELPAGFDKYRY